MRVGFQLRAYFSALLAPFVPRFLTFYAVAMPPPEVYYSTIAQPFRNTGLELTPSAPIYALYSAEHMLFSSPYFFLI